MALNTREMWSNGIKIAFIFEKITRLEAEIQTPVCGTFDGLNYIGVVNKSPNLDIFSLGLSPLPLAKFWLNAKPVLGFWSSILRYLFCFVKSLLRKFVMTSLHVIFGLGSPIKNPGFAYV